MADHLHVINRAFQDCRPEDLRLPDSRNPTAQLLALGANEELEDLVDRSHTTATILVRSTATSSRDLDRLGQRIDARLAALPSHLSGRATGNAMLLTRVTDAISRGQVSSLLAACAMIGAILCLYFRSVRAGLIALVPNLLPVAFYFGVMGFLGVNLNNATALMGSIVLGIAVDDTIHFLVHFRSAARKHGDERRAAAEALAEVGRPVTYTTIAICLGLLVVALSGLRTQANFGALGALTLAFAWVVDVVFTPALCSLLPTGGPGTTAQPDLTPRSGRWPVAGRPAVPAGEPYASVSAGSSLASNSNAKSASPWTTTRTGPPFASRPKRTSSVRGSLISR